MMTYFTTGHEELLVRGASFKKVDSLKARYVLVEAKDVSFERKYFVLCHHIGQICSLLEEVNLYRSSKTLVNHVAKLEALLERKTGAPVKRSSCWTFRLRALMKSL